MSQLATHRRLKTVLICLLFLILGSTPALAERSSGSRPNVIFILCDDLGWGDLGVFHQNQSPHDKRFQTPHLDQMALAGAQLRNHYCPAPVCAPSRASLLLGQHQGHSAIRDNQFDKALPNNHTLASVLKTSGYRTAIIGKYGLQGDQRYAMKQNGTKPSEWPAYPTKRGFDEFFGYVRHVDGHVHYPADRWELGNSDKHKSPKELWHNDEEISSDLANCYTTDLFTAYAKHWISGQQKADSDQPFFLYLAFDTPHAALQVPSCPFPNGFGLNGGVQWTGQPGKMINTAQGPIDSYRHPDTQGKDWSDVEQRFVTMVRRIDDCVGDLLQTLRDLEIDDETLVVLSSDNGPHHESYLASSSYEPTSFQSYGPFDGTKRDTWEGGIRVPTLAHWPGAIPAGTIDRSPSQFHDWMATFADVAGVSSPAVSDGVSLLPTLTASGPRRESTIYVEYLQRGRTPQYSDFESRKRGMRRGQMQVVHLDGYKGVRVDIQSHADDFQIYDLAADPKELVNLAGSSDAFRDLNRRMKQRVLRLRRPNASAPRPYDNEMVESVSIDGEATLGGQLRTVSHSEGYVPEVSLNAEPTPVDWQSFLSGAESSETVARRFDAWLNVPESGVYRFELPPGASAVIRMHEMMLINCDRPKSIGPQIASVKLQKGLHPITVQTTRSDSLSLRWARGGESFKAIPNDALVSFDKSK